MAGADWDEILAATSPLNFSGLDLDGILAQLGKLSSARLDQIVTALEEEKQRMKRAGDLLDTALSLALAVVNKAVSA